MYGDLILMLKKIIIPVFVFLLNLNLYAQENPCYASPEIDSHLGVWEGEYRYYDSKGMLVKQHRSRLTLQRKCNVWIQKNEYFYPEGKKEVLDFQGHISPLGVLTYDLGRVEGKAWGTQEGIVILNWTYKGKQDRNAEMIHLIAPNARMRSWQLSENGTPTGFVQITEHRV